MKIFKKILILLVASMGLSGAAQPAIFGLKPETAEEFWSTLKVMGVGALAYQGIRWTLWPLGKVLKPCVKYPTKWCAPLIAKMAAWSAPYVASGLATLAPGILLSAIVIFIVYKRMQNKEARENSLSVFSKRRPRNAW